MSSTLRHLRKAKGWSQKVAAEKLGLSQPYLSLLERGQRELTPALSRLLLRKLGLSPAFLPLPSSVHTVDADVLAKQLAKLGYQPFAYLKPSKGHKENPAAVLLKALATPDLEPRLVEALPWLLLAFPNLDTNWLAQNAKVQDLQNRLGFVVSLARDVAAKTVAYHDRLNFLETLLTTLQRSRLVLQNTLCEESMSPRMQQVLMRSRSADAKYWNLVTGWKAEHLRYEP